MDDKNSGMRFYYRPFIEYEGEVPGIVEASDLVGSIDREDGTRIEKYQKDITIYRGRDGTTRTVIYPIELKDTQGGRTWRLPPLPAAIVGWKNWKIKVSIVGQGKIFAAKDSNDRATLRTGETRNGNLLRTVSGFSNRLVLTYAEEGIIFSRQPMVIALGRAATDYYVASHLREHGDINVLSILSACPPSDDEDAIGIEEAAALYHQHREEHPTSMTRNGHRN